MTRDERQLARAYLVAKETGFARMASLRSVSTSTLDDRAATETFIRIAGDAAAPSTSPRPMTGLITQQAWFSRLHHDPAEQ